MNHNIINKNIMIILLRSLILLMLNISFIFSAYSLELNITKNSDLVGSNTKIKANAGDDFLKISHRFNINFHEIKEANPSLNPWYISEGKLVIIPQQFILPNLTHVGIIISLSELRLYYFPANNKNKVFTFPIGIGRHSKPTPLGKTKIVAKKKNPTWYVPPSILAEYKSKNKYIPKIVPPGPQNPLGKYALYLGFPSYLIHGTNQNIGVGLRVSSGCIRLHPTNIAELFKIVPVGTEVHIIDEIFKIGKNNNIIYLEVTKPLRENKKYHQSIEQSIINIKNKISNKFSTEDIILNLDKIKQAIIESKGIPIAIGKIKQHNK